MVDVTPRTIGLSGWRDGVVNFPVIGGALDLNTAASQAFHSGGLTFAAGGDQTQMTFQSLILDTTSVPMITGLASVQGKLLGRIPVFDLAHPSGINLPLKPDESRIILKDVGVSLDSAAAQALNSVFPSHCF